jgi:DNA-binding response OmpR family regulator
MGEPTHALVVDDEDALRFFLQETLKRAGMDATGAASGEEALELLRDRRYDLAILDLMLGGRIDGLKVLEAIRWRWPDMAVIILTAHGSLQSAMAAIREGIDGYLLKPVEPAELRQAVQEALARHKGPAGSRAAMAGPAVDGPKSLLEHGPFVIDLNKHEAAIDGRPMDLTPREFTLLTYLIDNADRAISQEELVQAIQEFKPIDKYEARDIIKWYIYRLRRKIEPDPAEPRYILNVRGIGYRFGE